MVDWNKDIIHKEFYNGLDCVKKFYLSLHKLRYKLFDLLEKSVKPLKMTSQDEAKFQASNECVICSKPLLISEAVRDHDHLSGLFRGASHTARNLKREVLKRIPVFFHNLKNFDSHYLLK